MHEIRRIFEKCLEIQDPSQRNVYLAEVCKDDTSLKKEVEDLLAEHARTSSFFLDRNLNKTTEHHPIAEKVGSQIGPYRLMEQIGEGGMGLVFVAEQTKPMRRKVALKIIKPGMDTKNVVARFEAERQALALMDHPNIARVLDGGETESGRPFFVMELVKGVPITEYCDRRNLSPPERLRLFLDVCKAIQHAHQKGVIHRDLKPSNVLVTEHGGSAVAKVIDFGVAKATNQQLTDLTVYTAFQQVIGTPLYMSPEQADLSGLDVDTRSDVYSLGVLLYELLTGVTPFDKQRFHRAAFDEIRRIIREEEPPKPSTRVSTLGDNATSISGNRQTEPSKLKQLLFGELDWIVMKALDKDRSRRYESASSFADDVQAFLEDEPVQACPPSFAYKAKKLFRRNRIPVAIAASFLMVLAASSIVAWTLYGKTRTARNKAEAEQRQAIAAKNLAEEEKSRAQTEQNRAENAEQSLRQRVYDISMMHATNAFNENDTDRTKRFLQECPEEHRNFEWKFLSAMSGTAKSSVHCPGALQIVLSPDGETYCAVMSNGSVALFDAKDNTNRWTYEHSAPDRVTTQVIFDRTGEHVAFNSHSNGFSNGDPAKFMMNPSMLLDHINYRCTCLVTATGDELLTVKGASGVLFSTENKLAATIPTSLGPRSSGHMEVWDIESKTKILRTKATYAPLAVTAQVVDHSNCFFLQRYGNNTTAGCLNLVDGTLSWTNMLPANIERIDFDKSGNLLAYGGRNRLGATSASLAKLDRHTGDIEFKTNTPFVANGNHALSPDGKYVASVLANSIVIWDTKSGDERFRIKESAVNVEYSDDGNHLRILKEEGTRLDVIEVNATPISLTMTLPHAVKIKSLEFDESGTRLLSTSLDDCVRMWNIDSGELLRSFWVRQPCSAAFISESSCLIGSGDGIHQWNLDTGFAHRFPDSKIIRSMKLTSDGKHAEVVGHHRTVSWNIGSQTLVREQEDASIRGLIGSSIAIFPDDRHVIENRQGYRVTDRTSGGRHTTLARLEVGRTGLQGVATHPEKNIAACGVGNRIELLQLMDGLELETINTLRRHTAPVTACAFLPDGKRLVSGDRDGNLLIWNTETHEVIAEYPNAHSEAILTIAASPHGERLATGGMGFIRIWEATPVRSETTALRIQTAAALKELNDRWKESCLAENVIRSVEDDESLSYATRQIATRMAHAMGDQRYTSAQKVADRKRSTIWQLVSDGKEEIATQQLYDALCDLQPDKLCWLEPTKEAMESEQTPAVFLTNATDSFPHSWRMHFLHALLLTRDGKNTEAEAVLNTCLDLAAERSHEWLMAAELKAYLLLSQDRNDDYQSLCEELVDAFGSHENTLLRIRATLIVLVSDSVAPPLLAKTTWIEDLEPTELAFLHQKWAYLLKGVYFFRQGEFEKVRHHLGFPYHYWSFYEDQIFFRENGFSFLANCFRVRNAHKQNRGKDANALGTLLERGERALPTSARTDSRGISLQYPHLRLLGDIVKADGRMTTPTKAPVTPAFWGVGGSFKQAIAPSYKVTWEEGVAWKGKCSLAIEALTQDPAYYASSGQTVNAKSYLGERIKLSAYIKTADDPSGTGTSNIWLRIDGSQTDYVFDNMADRSVKGIEDWTSVEIVVDVPDDAVKIVYGCLHQGNGKAWFDDLQLEIVSDEVPTTNPSFTFPSVFHPKPTDQQREKMLSDVPERDAIANPSFEIPGRSLGIGTEPDGQKVTSVDAGSLAEQIGIRAGDIVLQIGDKEIKTRHDAREAIHTPGRKKQIKGLRDSKEMSWTVEFDW